MDSTLIEIGRELSRQREAKGLSTSQIADELKISREFIEKLENGCFDFLPDVYIRGFLKTYARRIGLNPDILLRQLENVSADQAFAVPRKPELPHDSVEPVITPETTGKKESSSKFSPLKGRFGWIVFFTVFLVLSFLYFQKIRSPVSEKIDTTPIIEDSTGYSPVEDDLSVAIEKSERLTLTVTALDTTWLRIVYDDSSADEGIFTPGDRKTWQSDERFFLRLGNAGGLDFVLDGQNLGAPGQAGAISNIVIDCNGFSQIPYSDLPPEIFPERR